MLVCACRMVQLGSCWAWFSSVWFICSLPFRFAWLRASCSKAPFGSKRCHGSFLLGHFSLYSASWQNFRELGTWLISLWVSGFRWCSLWCVFCRLKRQFLLCSSPLSWSKSRIWWGKSTWMIQISRSIQFTGLHSKFHLKLLDKIQLQFVMAVRPSKCPNTTRLPHTRILWIKWPPPKHLPIMNLLSHLRTRSNSPQILVTKAPITANSFIKTKRLNLMIKNKIQINAHTQTQEIARNRMRIQYNRKLSGNSFLFLRLFIDFSILSLGIMNVAQVYRKVSFHITCSMLTFPFLRLLYHPTHSFSPPSLTFSSQ